MIVVIPDGWSRWGCGQWVDSPVTGNYEQYVIQDVIGFVDATYRTIPTAASRGVFGSSSGGFGSWNLASRHPDVLGAMAVLSADSWLDMTHKFMLYKYLDSIWPEAPNGPIAGNFWAEIVYNYSATYSPNVDNPPFFVDLPMAFPSGEIRQDVWDRWLSFDPAVNWRDRIDNLKQLRGILLDAGAKDDYNLHWGHRLLSHYLTEAGVPHLHTENPGNHGGRALERCPVALRAVRSPGTRAGLTGPRSPRSPLPHRRAAEYRHPGRLAAESGERPHDRGVPMLSSARKQAATAARSRSPRRFYVEETLGFILVSTGIQPRGVRYEAAEGARFLVFPSSGRPSGTHTQMGFQVDDIAAEVAELQLRGVVFETHDMPEFDPERMIATFPTARSAWFKDTEGNLIGLVELPA